MLSGADLRQALQAGLWDALADGSECAAMRAACRDARDMADALHETAVLPVGPGTWDSGGAIAAYHRRLGAVRSVHVVYSGGAEGDEARAAHFMEAYSTALGAALPAGDCSIAMPYGRQLPTPLAAVLLQRVVPHVERLDMALGSYGNVAQLLRALEPCARLCSLRLLPVRAADGPGYERNQNVEIRFYEHPGALGALCRLPRLHTLSGPWVIEAPDLQRLCDALPSLTTLGFMLLNLHGAPGACISRRLHTLAAWCHSAGHAGVRLDRPWHQQRSTCCITYACSLQSVLPAVRNLDALVLCTWKPREEDLPAIQAMMLRFAACAERWAWKVTMWESEDLQALRGIPPGSLADLRHLIVAVYGVRLAPADVASALGGLVSAALNIATLVFDGAIQSYSTEKLTAMMQPLRRAAHLRVMWLSYSELLAAARQVALLEGVVRCLAQPGAEGGNECCRTLRHVLLARAQPGALAACRAALARDGFCVSVGTCGLHR